MNHGYCLEPNQCICHLGWSGPTCNDCTKQPNCPSNANCTEPAGCVCENDLDGRCIIKNNPPKLTTRYKSPKHVMTPECVRFNSHVKEDKVSPLIPPNKRIGMFESPNDIIILYIYSLIL